MQNRKDNWFWLFDSNGNFSVRSGYRQLQGEIQKPHAKFWSRLWNLQLPGKVVNLVWRACRACLPTMMALANKRVSADKVCPWCLQVEETDIHVLFDCSFARSVWLAFGLQNSVQLNCNDKVFDVVLRAFESLSLQRCALFGLACWSIWKRRNDWVWNKVKVSVQGVKAGAMAMLQDWKNAKKNEVQNSQGRTQVADSGRMWCCPAVGWVKVNTDASVFEDMRSVGLGCVARGDTGEFLMARACRYRGLLTPRDAEALGLKEAICWAVEKGFKRCIFETDAKVVVDAIHGSHGRDPFHMIVKDCISLFKHFDDVLVVHVSRSANEVAHLLAKANRSMSDLVQEWVINPPHFISDVIVMDSC